MIADQEEKNFRWDLHTERQLSSAKGLAAAVTLLNSGSWLALLSQAGSLQGFDVGAAIGFWGGGALFGTAIWGFIYLSTVYQGWHDFDRDSQFWRTCLVVNRSLGMLSTFLSLICFAGGVFHLSKVFAANAV